jgi:hypothetical protein
MGIATEFYLHTGKNPYTQKNKSRSKCLSRGSDINDTLTALLIIT